jgi:CheY-like chemotaxis protein
VSRIVIADNDAEWLALMALDLELEGHEVVAQAASGDEALASCAATAPDVLVVDYRMPPGIDGVAVALRLRETAPEIAVVVFSNYEDPVVERRAIDAGARFVLKTNLRALRAAINPA